MRWWGKAAGGTVGFAFLGPVGAVVGAFLGHGFDKGLAAELDQPRKRGSAYPFRETLLEATFTLLGHTALADGRLTAAKRRVVKRLVKELELEPTRARAAWQAFETGQQPSFDPDTQLHRLNEISRGRPQLSRAFLDMQMAMALADGNMSGATRVALKRYCQSLGISMLELAQTEALARVRAGAAKLAPVDDDPVQRACQVLGVDVSADTATVKQAYRRLLSRHHPDKIAGSEPGEAAMRDARDRTHEIRSAYETVMAAREG